MDPADESISVEFVFCPAPGAIEAVTLVLPRGATAGDALRASGLGDPPGGLGVWGKRCDASRTLADGDRVEAYRSLLVDPMEARRRRQRHQRALSGNLGGNLSGNRPR